MMTPNLTPEKIAGLGLEEGVGRSGVVDVLLPLRCVPAVSSCKERQALAGRLEGTWWLMSPHTREKRALPGSGLGGAGSIVGCSGSLVVSAARSDVQSLVALVSPSPSRKLELHCVLEAERRWRFFILRAAIVARALV